MVGRSVLDGDGGDLQLDAQHQRRHLHHGPGGVGLGIGKILLPDGIKGVDCVLYNPCDDRSQTFRIQGRGASILEDRDMYEGKHDTEHHTTLTEFTVYAYASDGVGEAPAIRTSESSTCNYEIYFHPAPEFYSDMKTNGPAIFTACIAAVFIGTGLIFLVYVYLIGNRQNKVMAIAMSSSAIVSSLFPSTVRDRIMEDAQDEVKQRMSERSSHSRHSRHSRHSSLSRRSSMRRIQEERKEREKVRSKPIADLFPEATVLFADIVGKQMLSSGTENALKTQWSIILPSYRFYCLE